MSALTGDELHAAVIAQGLAVDLLLEKGTELRRRTQVATAGQLDGWVTRYWRGGIAWLTQAESAELDRRRAGFVRAKAAHEDWCDRTEGGLG